MSVEPSPHCLRPRSIARRVLMIFLILMSGVRFAAHLAFAPIFHARD